MESINKYREKDLSFLKVLIPMILIVVGVVLFLNGNVGKKETRRSIPNIPEPKQTEATGGASASAEATAEANPAELHECPLHTPVRRLDEVKAAREPVLRYSF